MSENEKKAEELLEAVYSGSLTKVEQLLSQREISSYINSTDAIGRTILIIAIRKGGPKEDIEKCLHKLLDHNDIKVDLCDLNGSTALHEACQQGMLSVVKRLLKKSETTNNTTSPTSNTIVNQKDKLQNTPLHLAIIRAHTDVVDYLIEKGADVNAVAKHNWSPLHQAAKAGLEKCVLSLLNAGADPEAKIASESPEGNKTPSEIAQLNNFPNIAKLIKESGVMGNPRHDRLKQKKIFNKITSDPGRGKKKSSSHQDSQSNSLSMDRPVRPSSEGPRNITDKEEDQYHRKLLLSRRITDLTKQMDNLSQVVDNMQSQCGTKNDQVLQVLSKIAPDNVLHDHKRTWMDIQSEIEEMHTQHTQLLYRFNETQMRMRLLEWIVVIFIVVYVFF